MNKYTCTIGELATRFDELMFTFRPNSMMEKGIEAKGFVIKNGKKLYWYITPYSSRGVYRCFPIEKDGTLGCPRYIYPDTEVTVIY